MTFIQKKKIDIFKASLLPEEKTARAKKIRHWQHAARLAAKNSMAVHKEFQPNLGSVYISLG